MESFPSLLFERLPGAAQKKPEYPMDRICAALAQIHAVQIDSPFELSTAFPFDDTCMIWLPTFEDYWKNKKHIPEITAAFATLAPIAQPLFAGEMRAQMFSRSVHVHCHGDVTPKNVFAGESGAARFFDFNNAFYGSRMADVIDGALEFSLAEKYIHLANFARFDKFVEHYSIASPLTLEEREDLGKWRDLIGVIKFTKEVRVMLERPTENLRRKRALAIAEFLASVPRG